MNDLKIFSGRANPELAKRICAYLGLPLGKISLSNFPDGEIMCKIDEDVRGRDIFIIQPTCPPVNENLMELLIMIDSFKRASAFRVTTVLPYFGYARQDRKDSGRCPDYSQTRREHHYACWCGSRVAMDLHAPQIQGFFDVPVDHLYGAPVLNDHFKTLGLDFKNEAVVVSADEGSIKVHLATPHAWVHRWRSSISVASMPKPRNKRI